MTVRLLVLLAVVAGAFGVVWLWERRPGSLRPARRGITLFVGPHCSMCGPALASLRNVGIEPDVVDVAAVEARRWAVRSVPTLIVADGRGRVLFRRSGAAVGRDAVKAAAAAGRWKVRSDAEGEQDLRQEVEG